MDKVLAWVLAEAETERLRRLSRDRESAGPVNPTNAVRARARGEVLREAVYCLRLLSHAPPQGADRLGVLLSDPHRPLVEEVLRAIGQWRLLVLLPNLLTLYEGAAAGERGVPCAALRACLRELTGRDFDGPAALSAWLAACDPSRDQSRLISSRTDRRDRAALPTRWIASTQAAVRRSTCFAAATSRTAP